MNWLATIPVFSCDSRPGPRKAHVLGGGLILIALIALVVLMSGCGSQDNRTVRRDWAVGKEGYILQALCRGYDDAADDFKRRGINLDSGQGRPVKVEVALDGSAIRIYTANHEFREKEIDRFDGTFRFLVLGTGKDNTLGTGEGNTQCGREVRIGPDCCRRDGNPAQSTYR